MFYIMSAKNHITPTSKPNIEAIIEANNSGKLTIYVAQREYAFQKFSALFITSSGINTKDKACQTTYTQDTGNGYRNRGKLLTIENVIHVKDGKIVHHENDIGLTEKRSLWVCK